MRRSSPDRRQQIKVPSTPDAFPPMQPNIESDSSATDDDTKPIVANSGKKRSWMGRISIKRRKGTSEEKAESKQLALQEDSSVSSWSRGSPDSPGTVPYADSKPKADDMPPEMKLFGEDHGLAAAELAIRQEEEAKEISGSEDISQKSSSSLRDELDKAIESGDWAAVEAQTNKLFDTSLEEMNSELATIKPRVNSSSSFDDSEDNSREGWSTSSKSQKSEPIDDERIAMLEKLIETDDWQGIVTTSRIHNRDDSSMASSLQDEGLLSLATEREGAYVDGEDEDLSLATDTNTNTDQTNHTNNTNTSMYSA